ncbi:MAG: anthranilate synthase component I family protein, partial [Phycisphaerae bacterium]|nr:anthranilate synthase component I family protein [Phycisphaerae bacterium]
SAGSPFPLLRKVLKDFALPKDENAKLAFGPGMIGYLAYDLGTWIEPTVPHSAHNDIALPAMFLPLYDHLLLLDHQEQRAWGIAAGLKNSSKPPDAWLEEMAEWVAAGTGPEENSGPQVAAEPQFSCNFSRREYLMAVAQAREYIAAGDIFQVNLSQRFTSECDLEPAQVYLRLRRENPAPFSAFLGLGGDRAVLSSSPELFLKVGDGRVLTRPIKGTRPRRPTDEPFNAVMQEQLLASEKDAAELVMIVDLERNDLGRVCDYGSIHVTEPRALEAYASVHHSVASIEGTLFADADLVDLLKATFPGGSITGAPKVRAMQIIDELEPTRRSVYTGAIGHIGLDGRMALNIAIRTLIQMGRQVHMQVGGGIVADSTPG